MPTITSHLRSRRFSSRWRVGINFQPPPPPPPYSLIFLPLEGQPPRNSIHLPVFSQGLPHFLPVRVLCARDSFFFFRLGRSSIFGARFQFIPPDLNSSGVIGLIAWFVVRLDYCYRLLRSNFILENYNGIYYY